MSAIAMVIDEECEQYIQIQRLSARQCRQPLFL